jgi:hypothetical protein
MGRGGFPVKMELALAIKSAVAEKSFLKQNFSQNLTIYYTCLYTVLKTLV